MLAPPGDDTKLQASVSVLHVTQYYSIVRKAVNKCGLFGKSARRQLVLFKVNMAERRMFEMTSESFRQTRLKQAFGHKAQQQTRQSPVKTVLFSCCFVVSHL